MSPLSLLSPLYVDVLQYIDRYVTIYISIARILATLAVNFILSSMNLQRIWEVGRGWGD